MSDLSIRNNAAPATVIQHFYEAAIVPPPAGALQRALSRVL
jgi:hypothetical protein